MCVQNYLSELLQACVSPYISWYLSFTRLISGYLDMQVCVILRGVIGIGVDSYFIAVMACLLLLVVLGFIVHVLDNVIETVYVCYAIDRDTGDVCKQEVHDVYVNLPISRNHRSHIARTPLV